jgi:hypothetical protein
MTWGPRLKIEILEVFAEAQHARGLVGERLPGLSWKRKDEDFRKAETAANAPRRCRFCSRRLPLKFGKGRKPHFCKGTLCNLAWQREQWRAHRRAA